MQTIFDGTLLPDGSLVLDGKPNLEPGRVRVTIEAKAPVQDSLPKRTIMDAIRDIYAEQDRNGYVPGKNSTTLLERDLLRRDMEEEIEATIRLQEECRARRKAFDEGSNEVVTKETTTNDTPTIGQNAALKKCSAH
jgi:hypothetical protein